MNQALTLKPGQSPAELLAEVRRPRRRAHKYNAQPTNGYASKREAAYAHELAMRQLAANGDVTYWIAQVPVKLGGGNKYVCDFLVFKRDGSHEYVEVKGFETPVWRNKMRQLAAERPEIFARLKVVR